MRLEASLAHTIAAPGGRGLLTRYGKLAVGGTLKRYRLGLRWTLDEVLEIRLNGERRERGGQDDNAEQVLWLEGVVWF